jgi:glycerol kinase
VLESVCFQVCEISAAMTVDSGCDPQQFLVDGGMTGSDVFLQLQANLLGVEVVMPGMKEVRSVENCSGFLCRL